MYEPFTNVLCTNTMPGYFGSILYPIYSNGTYVRSKEGTLLGRETKKYNAIPFHAGFCGQIIKGYITDKILVERIERYWLEHAGIHHTNCSTFAHYLTTGRFLECSQKMSRLIIEQGMRPYEMASNIGIGDMVCLMYANDRLGRSRKNKYAHRYRKAKKCRHDEGTFNGTASMGLRSRAFSPQEIIELYIGLRLVDYHFMVCVAKSKGKPVWLSQGGYAEPGMKTMFLVTANDNDCYLHNIPIIAFIKKRR